MKKQATQKIENCDLGLGICADESCGKWAVVGLNGKSVCLEHFGAGLKRARACADSLARTLEGVDR